MKNCSYCGVLNEDGAVVCHQCGDQFPVTGVLTHPARTFSFLELKNDARQVFRVLVITSTVTSWLWFLELRLMEKWIAPELWDALAWQSYGSWLLFPAQFAWLRMLLSSSVAVGLYKFARSARTVFLSLMIFDLIIVPFMGVQVQTAFGSFLGYVAGVANGAILAMAYWAPLKEDFS